MIWIWSGRYQGRVSHLEDLLLENFMTMPGELPLTSYSFCNLTKLIILLCKTEGEDLARQFGCAFIEASAKSRINVDNAFYNIVREIRRYNKEMSGYNPGGSGMGNNVVGQRNGSMHGKQGGCCSRCVVM